MQRLAGMVNVPVAVGLGCFLAWMEALTAFLNPVSRGLVFSPMVCKSFAACLVLAIAVHGFVRNRGAFQARAMRRVVAALIVVSTAAGALIVHGIGGAALAYAGAAVIGCAASALLYVWADILAAQEIRARLGTVLAALLLCSLFGVVLGECSARLLGICSCVLEACTLLGFFLSVSHRGLVGDEPLILRPTSSNHFKLLLLAVVLYAFVLGVSGGTTAYQATASNSRSFVQGMSWVMTWVSLALLGALVLWGKSVRLSTAGRFLTPVFALLFLFHVLFQGSMGGWLPRLTAGFWQLFQLFVVLVLIDVARSGMASLSFVFPVGWAIVSLGYALGGLVGQGAGACFGTDPTAVNAIAVILVIVAVVASSILGAAQYPCVPRDSSPFSPQVLGGDAPSTDGAMMLTDKEEPAPDPIDVACGDLVERYGLSGRERSVLELLARGNTRAGIAERLFISENTVRVHVKNIYSKLHIHSKQQLIDMVDKRAD